MLVIWLWCNNIHISVHTIFHSHVYVVMKRKILKITHNFLFKWIFRSLTNSSTQFPILLCMQYLLFLFFNLQKSIHKLSVVVLCCRRWKKLWRNGEGHSTFFSKMKAYFFVHYTENLWYFYHRDICKNCL